MKKHYHGNEKSQLLTLFIKWETKLTAVVSEESFFSHLIQNVTGMQSYFGMMNIIYEIINDYQHKLCCNRPFMYQMFCIQHVLVEKWH
jgi:hypothetical protein